MATTISTYDLPSTISTYVAKQHHQNFPPLHTHRRTSDMLPASLKFRTSSKNPRLSYLGSRSICLKFVGGGGHRRKCFLTYLHRIFWYPFTTWIPSFSSCFHPPPSIISLHSIIRYLTGCTTLSSHILFSLRWTALQDYTYHSCDAPCPGNIFMSTETQTNPTFKLLIYDLIASHLVCRCPCLEI